MEEPAKPFACTMPECGMSFTNEDRLHVHTKKHDMELQLGLEQKAGFVADHTPTPTRFLRNCEEVGLFQDLQNVNPFDEGFKRAMETKQGLLSLESALSGATDDVLHTPQMVFPLIDNPEASLYSATNNQRNITISRSSSDESGSIKEYETTTISKLTNEVTTISRIVGNRDVIDKIVNSDEVDTAKTNDNPINKDNINDNINIINEKVYTNNIIKIHSNVEIRKDGVLNINNNIKNTPVLIYTDSVIKDRVKDVLLTDSAKLQVEDKVPPIMSQKSLDFVVDSLTKDMNDDKHFDIAKNDTEKASKVKVIPRRPYNTSPDQKNDVVDDNNVKAENTEVKRPKLETQEAVDEYEVIIKLPGGKKVKMKPVDDTTKTDAKEVIRKRLTYRRKQKSETPLHNMLQLQPGTLIPVTLVNPVGLPIPMAPKKLPLSANPKNTSAVTELKTVLIGNGSNNINVLPVISVEGTTELPRPPKRVLDRAKAENSRKETDSINKEVNNTQVPDTAKRKKIVQEKHKEVRSDNNLSGRTENDSEVITIDDDETTPAKAENNAKAKFILESRSAASKRYRVKLKDTMKQQAKDIRILEAENAALKLMITEHAKCCSNAMDLSARLEKLRKYLSSVP